MTTELAPTPPPAQGIGWPNLSRSAELFGVSIAAVSRWADAAHVGEHTERGRVLRPSALLRIAEQQGRSLYNTAERIFDFSDAATDDETIRRSVRTEINEYLADYQRRRDPARVVTIGEVLEELRTALSPAEFERVRARLEGQALPKPPDMFSAEPTARRRRRGRAASRGVHRRASPSGASPA